MPIPETGQEIILEAIRQYQQGDRSPNWREGRGGWMQNRNHQYAIRHEGEYYPVKEIIRLSVRIQTGQWYTEFSGGMVVANPYVERYGFEIAERPFD